jgi:glycosyltransferase involved in cell wall biosynthesis
MLFINSMRVSVVMCTYNGEKYLSEQIDSILRQTYEIYELLIVDDQSNDGTCNILDAYSKQFSFIKIYHNKTKLGVKENFKKGFSLASGDYIAVSDQDDIWASDKVEKLINAIGENYLVFSDSWAFEENESISGIQFPVSNIKFSPLRYVAFEYALAGHSVLFKSDLFKMIPESLWANFEYDFCLAISAIGLDKMIYVDQYLTFWRRHPTAFTYRSKSKKIWNIQKYFPQVSIKNTRKCYRTLLPLFLVKTSISYKFAYKMAHKSLLSACLFTYQHRSLLFPENHPLPLKSIIYSIILPVIISKKLGNWE